MEEAELRARIAQYRWFHSMELRPGVWTSGPKTPEILAAEAAAVFGPLDLTGRSLVDVGAWNGFFSLQAKRRGAARVLATDSFTWQHPDYRGRETLTLAAEALGLEIETREVEIAALGPEVGVFDVALFLGVFYHLQDPLPVLGALRRMIRGALVVETHQDALDLDRPAMIHYPGAELGGDPTNWWGPNPALMQALLTAAGFTRVLYRDHPMAGPGGPWPLRVRGLYCAIAEEAAAPLAAGGLAEWTDLGEAANRAALVLPARAPLGRPGP
ncbi:MAG TPA: DUF1698 domain-containing protein [Crenalkalicoccus sp.]|nr:DUF1698 domain-containing protein [Crenalkalicoccus sp.]